MIKHKEPNFDSGNCILKLRGKKIHKIYFEHKSKLRKIIREWEGLYLEKGHHEFSIEFEPKQYSFIENGKNHKL